MAERRTPVAFSVGPFVGGGLITATIRTAVVAVTARRDR